MPIDAGIPLQVRPPALEDPATLQARQMQLRDLMGQQQMRQMQMDQAQRAQREELTLSDLYRTSGGDPTKLRAGLASSGLGSRIPAFDKQQAELGTKLTERDAKKFELVRSQYDAVDGAMRSMLADPQLTADKVIGLLSAQAQSYREFPEMVEKLALEARNLPPDPGRLKQYLMQKLIEGQKGKEQLDALLPKVEYKQTGKQMVPVDLNPMTNPNPQALTMTTTPGEDMTDARTRAEGAANRGVTMRGQNLTDARTREATQAGKVPSGYRYKADGTLEAIPGGPAAEKLSDPKQKVSDATEALALINQAGPMLKSSTGSTVGMVIDKMVGAFGYSTPGSISAQSLKALEGALIGKMPKMSGPQSDKDVQLYRQMAAVVGDDTVPYAQKVAALETVREIQERQAGLKPGSSRPAPAKPKPAAQNQALHDQADAILRGD